MTRRVLEKLYTEKVCIDFLAPKELVSELMTFGITVDA